MRRRTLTGALIGAACAAAITRPAPAGAQDAVSTARTSLPRDVRREAVDRWNGQNALRATEQRRDRARARKSAATSRCSTARS